MKKQSQYFTIPSICFIVLLMLMGCRQNPPVKTGFVPTDDPGPYKVRIVDDMILHDDIRNRDIPMKIYYPEGIGPFPVLIYSHGLLGSKDTKRYLGEFMASHGFVDIHITHYGSDTSIVDIKKLLLSRTVDPETMEMLRGVLANRDRLTERPLDVSKVIDSFDFIESQIPDLKGKIERAAIGVHGHSFGAFTTLAIAGAFKNDTVKKEDRDYSDPRPKAFLAMSPQAANPGQSPSERFGTITRPVMIMTGSLDTDNVMPDRTAESRLEPFKFMAPGEKYALWITGAHHYTFGDSRLNRKPDPEHHKWIKIVHLAFWEAYLEGDKTAKAFLQSDKIAEVSKGNAKIMHR